MIFSIIEITNFTKVLTFLFITKKNNFKSDSSIYLQEGKSTDKLDEKFIVQLVDSFYADYVLNLKSKKSRTDSIEAYYRFYNRIQAFAPEEIEKYLTENDIENQERKQLILDRFIALKQNILSKINVKKH